jgi:hypothetical protein
MEVLIYESNHEKGIIVKKIIVICLLILSITLIDAIPKKKNVRIDVLYLSHYSAT